MIDNIEEIIDTKVNEHISVLNRKFNKGNKIKIYPKKMDYDDDKNRWCVSVPLIICPKDKYDFVRMLDFETASKQYQSIIINFNVDIE